MKKTKKLHLRKRDAEIIARAALPHIFLHLARVGLLKKEDVNEPAVLFDLLLRHRKMAIAKIAWCAAPDYNFLKESCKYWQRSEKMIALVLYATALEQCINSHFQLILESKGWSQASATALIRTSNIDSKLSWIFETFVGKHFPAHLKHRVQKVFEIRNAIVHFKGITGPVGEERDSYSLLEGQIEKLRRMSLSRDFRLVESALVDGMLNADPHRDLALRAAHVLDASVHT